MFVQEELAERLMMLNRHSYIPHKLVKYRKNQLGRVSPRRRLNYKKEVKSVISANRNFINSYLKNNSMRGNKRPRQTMDLLYAVRAHALSNQTLDYMICLAQELHDLDGNFGL